MTFYGNFAHNSLDAYQDIHEQTNHGLIQYSYITKGNKLTLNYTSVTEDEKPGTQITS